MQLQNFLKQKQDGLIVIEREIKIKDIIETGVILNAEVSPQLLVNLFTPNTPLHDGAVIISENKIVSAACILPLASSQDIAKELGTRHRAAIGISKESDAIAIVVSEETGKISIAKDGTLIADLREDALKKILIKNVVTDRFKDDKNSKKTILNIRNKINRKIIIMSAYTYINNICWEVWHEKNNWINNLSSFSSNLKKSYIDWHDVCCRFYRKYF